MTQRTIILQLLTGASIPFLVSVVLVFACLACDKTDESVEEPVAEAELAGKTPDPESTSPAPDEVSAEDEDEHAENESPENGSEKNMADQATANAQEASIRKLNVVRSGSFVDFVMKAPLENIHGKAPSSVSGSISFRPNDITSLRGKVEVDLIKLSIYQQKRDSADGEFSKEVKNATQNEHMRTWFQISGDAPQSERKKNRVVTFEVTNVTAAKKDVTALSGDTRTLNATVEGKFTLHQITKTKKVPMRFIFSMNSDGSVKSVKIKTSTPVRVSLPQHRIEPRSAFDKLAQKSLAALGQKVATVAPVTISFEAR